MNIDEYIQQADSIVSNHCGHYKKTFPHCGVLLSGGIDSSVITTYVLKHFEKSTIFSMGTSNTKDKPFVDLFSQSFQVRYEWVELLDAEIKKALPQASTLLVENGVENSTMQQSLGVGYYLIFQRAQKLGIKGIVTGQGPDILFAGYHKYSQLEGTELEASIKSDIALLEVDKKRDAAMASFFGIALLNPYLEEDFVSFALTVPTELKRKDGVEKYFMRKWGEGRGLPQAIVNRPKKAFQYSTGLQKSVQHILDI